MKIKINILLLLASLFLCFSTFAQSDINIEPLKGDVNEDGKVDVADIVAIMGIIMNGNDFPVETNSIYSINGMDYPIPELVDLGLPSGTLWAKTFLRNDKYNMFTIDNTESEDYTDSYLGATHECESFQDDSSIINVHQNMKLKNDIISYLLGKGWSMPTYGDVVELYENCEIENVVEDNHQIGMKLTSKINGKSVLYENGGMVYSDGKQENLFPPSYYGSCFWTKTFAINYNNNLDGMGDHKYNLCTFAFIWDEGEQNMFYIGKDGYRVWRYALLLPIYK